jgi:5-methylcytosine-specific restriction endonuclease McrA
MFFVSIESNGEESRSYLNISPAFFRHMPTFKGAKLAILMDIAMHMDESGWAEVGIKTIEANTGLNPQTISSAITELCKMRINGQRVMLAIQERDAFGVLEHTRYRPFPTESEVAAFQGKERRPRKITSASEESKRHKREAKKAVVREYDKLYLQIGERDGFCCARCKTTDRLQIDHIQPVSKFGPSNLDNLQFLCEQCNQLKGDTFADYRSKPTKQD